MKRSKAASGGCPRAIASWVSVEAGAIRRATRSIVANRSEAGPCSTAFAATLPGSSAMLLARTVSVSPVISSVPTTT